MYQLKVLGFYAFCVIIQAIFRPDMDNMSASEQKKAIFLGPLFICVPLSFMGALIDIINVNASLDSKIVLWAYTLFGFLHIVANSHIKGELKRELDSKTSECERLDYSYKQLDKDFESFRLKHQQANEKKLFATIEKFVKEFQSDAYEIDCLPDCISYLKDERGYYPTAKDWTVETDFDKEAIDCIQWCASDAIEWGKNNPQSANVWCQWMQIYRGTIDWLLENGYITQDEAESDCQRLCRQIRYNS